MLKVNHIHKKFNQKVVLHDLSLTLPRQQTLSILGASGSGKTTLLKIIAGLEQAEQGTVQLDGQSIDYVPAHRRNIVYLYQESLLFPHLNVYENLAFGLRLRRMSRPEIHQKTEALLQQLGMAEHTLKCPISYRGGRSNGFLLAGP
ncbi:MAG: ATP-binding cassette domain-containing protein [Bacteroidia bacterium]|nr:ATP-binding cassette domain-containing protein [Bacteroidia bacterium]